MATLSVDLVNLDKRFVVLSTGRILPITNFRDEDGDDCDVEDAAFVFAGTAQSGCLIIHMATFEGETVH